ncbi:hypothetical protein Pcinc_044437, partial [Petrolisthes cinctipes]
MYTKTRAHLTLRLDLMGLVVHAHTSRLDQSQRRSTMTSPGQPHLTLSLAAAAAAAAESELKERD